MKTCTGCQQEKPLSEFHLMYGKPRPKCKDCARAYKEANRDKSILYARRHRERHLEERRAADREYHRGRKTKRIRERERAREALRKAVKLGKIVKPGACEDCGIATEKSRLHGHHENYDERLRVEWLCSGCHGKRHRRPILAGLA